MSTTFINKEEEEEEESEEDIIPEWSSNIHPTL